MAATSFSFREAEIPRAERGQRSSKYVATVEEIHQYLAEHRDQRSVKVELGETSIKSAVASFRNAVSRRYPDSLRVVQRGGDLYVAKR